MCSKVLNENELIFGELEKGIEMYYKLGKTFISGDLNSKTGKLPDIVERIRYLDASFDSENICETEEYLSLIYISFSRNNRTTRSIIMVKNGFHYVNP